MKRENTPFFKALFLLLVLPMSAVAQLRVIYDSGQTRPIAPFLQAIQQIESRSAPINTVHPATASRQLGPAQISNLLPISSPELSPGVILTNTSSQDAFKRLALGNARPFFLVGSDDLSHRWLKSRKAELLKLGAVGMLIQAETEADVRRIAELGQGLSITLGSATDIAKVLGIVHYPVLITSRGIEQ